jgi:hypothetical protein
MRILPFSHCAGSRDHPRKIRKEDNNSNNKKGEKKSHWKKKGVDKKNLFDFLFFKNEPRLEQLAVIACNLVLF